MTSDAINRFREALPALSTWIDETLAAHQQKSSPVIRAGFPRLRVYFPRDVLESSRFVEVPSVPFPPLEELGLKGIVVMPTLLAGVTYRDTFFVRRSYKSESLYFHELVHVVQWQRLGVERFLLAYGAGLLQFGYERSPLERMAKSLEQDFARGLRISGLVNLIHDKTDRIWANVAPFLGAVRT